MAYDRTAFLARFLGGLDADQAEAAARHAEYDRQRNELRIATGHPLARPATTTAAVPTTPSLPTPAARRPAPIVALPPTTAEIKFERVRAAACARINAERETRRAEKAAVAMILEAYATFEPADRPASRAPQRGTDAEEAAVNLILSFMSKQRS